MIAAKAEDLTGALIATGAMAHMMIQIILNIAVVTNSIPNTGITLPFISYGGTSVVFFITGDGTCAECFKLFRQESEKKRCVRKTGQENVKTEEHI